MKVYISSASQLKHDVVKETFQMIGHDVETVAVPTASGVSEQPSSIEETYRGAENRQNTMLHQIGAIASGDCFVTIESGIYVPIKKRGTYFGTTSIIVQRDDEVHVGIDSDIEFPKELTDRVPRDYKDLGALVQAEHGATDSDPIKHFTNGQRSRRSFMQSALVDVLIQFKGLAKHK